MATQNLVVDLARSVALPSGVKFLHELAKNYEWQSKKTVDNHGEYGQQGTCSVCNINLHLICLFVCLFVCSLAKQT